MFLLYPKPRCDEGIDDISIIIHRSAVALMASKLFSEIFCSYFQYTASLRLSNIGLPSDVCPDSTVSDLVHKADIPYISCNCKSNIPMEMINRETRAMTLRTKTLIIINIDVCTTFLGRTQKSLKNGSLYVTFCYCFTILKHSFRFIPLK